MAACRMMSLATCALGSGERLAESLMKSHCQLWSDSESDRVVMQRMIRELMFQESIVTSSALWPSSCQCTLPSS
eukprot:2304319-Rhodomonas_salina.1